MTETLATILVVLIAAAAVYVVIGLLCAIGVALLLSADGGYSSLSVNEKASVLQGLVLVLTAWPLVVLIGFFEFFLSRRS